MSNILLAYGNKATGATLSGGQWESLLPLTNLKDGRLGKVARSDDATVYDTRFRFDLGANYVLRALALVNHNLTTAARWRVKVGTSPLDVDYTAADDPRDERVSYSGAANRTRVNSAGLIEAKTAPRIDYDPVTLGSKGLLAEEARENKAVGSEGTVSELDADRNATNAAVSITGFANSIDIQLAGTTSYAYKWVSFPDGTLTTVSVFVQMDDGLAPAPTNTTASGDFCMAADGWATSSEGVSAPTVEPFGGGRFRVWANVTASSAGNGFYGVVKSTAQSSRGFRVTGWQVEAGAFPTSYIPTTSAALTRTADSVSITGSNFSGFYSAGAGTIYVEHRLHYVTGSSGNRPIIIDDGDIQDQIYIDGYGGGIVGSAGVAGSYTSTTSAGSYTANANVKAAYAYAAGDQAVSLNGGAVGAGSFALPTGLTTLRLGIDAGGTVFTSGHIRRIAYWPTRRTNAELQSITTTGPEALGIDTGWQNALQMTFHGDTPTNWGEQYPLIAAFDARTARYGTVEIDDTTNTATYVQLGQLFIAGGFQPTENAEQQGFADGRTDLSSSVKSVGGQKYGTARRRPRTVDFSFPMLTLEEGDHLDEMMAEVGTTEDVLYVPDPSDAAKTQRYGFLGTLRELSPLEYPLADKRAVPLRMEQKL